jgi:formylglycine-generating enzyme required for sulfatase activity
VSAYSACVRAGSCPATHLKDRSFDGKSFEQSPLCNYGSADKNNHPVNCVSWDEADAYCRSKHLRLPTDSEWAWAARGGDARRPFPWGADAPSTQLCWDGEGSDLGKGRRAGTCAVGKYPGEPLHDMAGNVWEWTDSRRSPGSIGADDDCADDQRRLRGGGWDTSTASEVRVDARSCAVPAFRSYNLGFRCAANPADPRSAATPPRPAGSP